MTAPWSGPRAVPPLHLRRTKGGACGAAGSTTELAHLVTCPDCERIMGDLANREALRRGNLHADLCDLVRQHGVDDVRWMLGVIEDDLAGSK